MTPDVGFALLLSALAGLSTTIGSLLALFVRKPGPRLMTLTLGFSGGVMILVSFVELLPSGIEGYRIRAGQPGLLRRHGRHVSD